MHLCSNQDPLMPCVAFNVLFSCVQLSSYITPLSWHAIRMSRTQWQSSCATKVSLISPNVAAESLGRRHQLQYFCGFIPQPANKVAVMALGKTKWKVTVQVFKARSHALCLVDNQRLLSGHSSSPGTRTTSLVHQEVQKLANGPGMTVDLGLHWFPADTSNLTLTISRYSRLHEPEIFLRPIKAFALNFLLRFSVMYSHEPSSRHKAHVRSSRKPILPRKLQSGPRPPQRRHPSPVIENIGRTNKTLSRAPFTANRAGSRTASPLRVPL